MIPSAHKRVFHRQPGAASISRTSDHALRKLRQSHAHVVEFPVIRVANEHLRSARHITVGAAMPHATGRENEFRCRHAQMRIALATKYATYARRRQYHHE